MLKKNKYNYFIILLFTFLLLFNFTSYTVMANKNREIPTVSYDSSKGRAKLKSEVMEEQEEKEMWEQVIEKYRVLIIAFSGFGALTMIVVFIKSLVALAIVSPDNPSKRSANLTTLLWSGIATIGLGSVTLLTGFFYNAV